MSEIKFTVNAKRDTPAGPITLAMDVVLTAPMEEMQHSMQVLRPYFEAIIEGMEYDRSLQLTMDATLDGLPIDGSQALVVIDRATMLLARKDLPS